MHTLCKKSPAIAQFLDIPQPGRSYWEGTFTGVRGWRSGLTFDVCATIVFCAGVIDGDGQGVDFPYQAKCSRRFKLEGWRYASDVSLQLWFKADFLSRRPFVATGSIAADDAAMSGSWSLDCFSGKRCGCGGGFGKFELYRVDTR